MAAPADTSPQNVQAACCIAGGGPAGMMLGFLLARAGVETVILEKHADFLRDFRGDTIHPSTLEIMYELGILDKFLSRPHQEVQHLDGQVGDNYLTIADFTHLPTHCKFLALMPQWDFLDFIVQESKRYPAFHLRMQAEVTGLIEERGRVTGVRVTTPQGPLEVRADLIVAADGRGSVVRKQAGLEVIDLGAPMDVLWMRLSKRPDDPSQILGRVDPGHILVLLDRGNYWQCAFVIPKGAFSEVQKKGLDSFRADLAGLAPYLGNRVHELKDWNDIKLLTVAVDRLRQWYKPGLLAIGDAAHAMSPVGGVGINLAIQDAVAAANILSAPLRGKSLTLSHLRAVQRRREFPTRVTQRIQIFIQTRVIGRVLVSRNAKLSLPLPLKLLRRYPFLRRLPARVVGVGIRPEHVR
ncbi:MAG: FAD-dependent oxidoreductase [Acidobacteriota bacterium]|nr:FAD-dependent oxidoreductase [Acidobacteriota bacterium]